MDNEGAFEKAQKRSKYGRQKLAITYLDVLSKEHKGCDCPRYSGMEIALALIIVDSMDTFMEIRDLLPKVPVGKK